MNYLAHVFLAGARPEAIIGNLQGDFMQGVELDALTPGVRAGVLLHRAVDAFTDAHPVVRRAWDRLDPGLRLWRRPMVDVFFDHFLSRDFDSHAAGRRLTGFADGIYEVLAGHTHLMHGRLRTFAPRLVEHRGLEVYREANGVGRALRQMSQRRPRRAPLAAGREQLEAHYAGLAGDFDEFFPELVDRFGATDGAR